MISHVRSTDSGLGCPKKRFGLGRRLYCAEPSELLKRYGRDPVPRTLRLIGFGKAELYREYGAGFFGGETAKSRQFVPVQLFFLKLHESANDRGLLSRVMGFFALYWGLFVFCLALSCAPTKRPEAASASLTDQHNKETTVVPNDDTATIYSVIDRVDPLWNDDGQQIFDESTIDSLSGIADPEAALLQVVASRQTSLKRRFGAVEALFQGGWTQFRHDPEAEVLVARVMADAMVEDGIHNRWGLPGHFVGRTGKHLLTLRHGLTQALLPLLDNPKRLEIVGSDAATTQTLAGYRIADLAAYLLSIHFNLAWVDSPDTRQRDQQIGALKKSIGKALD